MNDPVIIVITIALSIFSGVGTILWFLKTVEHGSISFDFKTLGIHLEINKGHRNSNEPP